MKIFDYKDKGLKKFLERACSPSVKNAEVKEVAEKIIADVRARGDAALFEYAHKFDGAKINAKNVRVSVAEIKNALKLVPRADIAAIKEAIKCVEFFHKRTMPKAWRARNPHGAVVGENFYPINRVGVYIPGGKAPLVSTVVMTVTLARLAKCPEICVCTPSRADGSVNAHILAALSILGVDEIYKVGGAQAIAAMGVGTKSIKAVDKLYGPGNAFVIAAKRALFGEVGCDLLPGPSEVLVLADDKANPKFAASDLLSQAEHGSGKEKIFLVCKSKKFVEAVEKEIGRQCKSLSRAESLAKILKESCFAICVPDLNAAAEVANYICPEHMELQVDAASVKILSQKITTAGAVLSGLYTPTVLGDFTAGPSHTLPTERTGRFSGGLQLIDFMRRSSFVEYDKKSIACARKVVEAFTRMENLDAHGNSLLERLGEGI